MIPGEEVAVPRTDPALLRALARGYQWFSELAAGTAASTTQIAAREGVSASYVRRLVPLALLAPSIVESICAGRQGVCLSADRLKTQAGVPIEWNAQQRLLADWEARPLRFRPLRTHPIWPRGNRRGAIAQNPLVAPNPFRTERNRGELPIRKIGRSLHRHEPSESGRRGARISIISGPMYTDRDSLADHSVWSEPLSQGNFQALISSKLARSLRFLREFPSDRNKES